jgi:hypothetical protein
MNLRGKFLIDGRLWRFVAQQRRVKIVSTTGDVKFIPSKQVWKQVPEKFVQTDVLPIKLYIKNVLIKGRNWKAALSKPRRIKNDRLRQG